MYPNGHTVAARVVRVQSSGLTVRVELEQPDGSPAHAELTHDAYRASPRSIGQDVYLTPRNAFAFEEDYSI